MVDNLEIIETKIEDKATFVWISVMRIFLKVYTQNNF